MAGPGPERVEHYVRLFEHFGTSWDFLESMCWTVVRGAGAPSTVPDVLRRMGADPGALSRRRPVQDGFDPDVVFAEQRGDAVVLVAYSPRYPEEDGVRRLSAGATVHQVFWMINNHNALYYAVDGVLLTGLETLAPDEPWGAEPHALDEHLGALRDLRRRTAPGPDWETAMATMESISGAGLDAAWFDTPQWTAVVGGA